LAIAAMPVITPRSSVTSLPTIFTLPRCLREPALGQGGFGAVDAVPNRTQISYRRGLPPLATEVLRKITSS
jgi:hypothetical protein